MPTPPRTLLFVSAERPERFDKAMASGADVVCIDLEDAVHPDRKDAARSAAIAYPVEYEIERYYRDSILMCIGEGRNEILRTVIAKQLIDRHRI